MIYSYEPFTMCNVVSKRYFTNKIHIIDAEKDFFAKLIDQKVHLKGPLVYLIEYVSQSEILTIRFMVSIYDEYSEQLKDFRFDSYFGLEAALCCKIYPDEMQRTAKEIYDLMLQKAQQDHVTVLSPVYFTKSLLDNNGFFTLYAAVDTTN